MGQLPIFYTFCDLTIVAGSFGSRIGGHNVLEPCLYGCPTLFGPHMHQQTELAALLLTSGAGAQVDLATLVPTILAHQADPIPMRSAASLLSISRPSALATTWSSLQPKL
jgi:3-deoxy-D-manno-octulosonic-acid transferase